MDSEIVDMLIKVRKLKINLSINGEMRDMGEYIYSRLKLLYILKRMPLPAHWLNQQLASEIASDNRLLIKDAYTEQEKEKSILHYPVKNFFIVDSNDFSDLLVVMEAYDLIKIEYGYLVSITDKGKQAAKNAFIQIEQEAEQDSSIRSSDADAGHDGMQ